MSLEVSIHSLKPSPQSTPQTYLLSPKVLSHLICLFNMIRTPNIKFTLGGNFKYYQLSKTIKFIETKIKMLVARGSGKKR